MNTTKTTTPLRDRCLSHCTTLGIPLEGVSLDEVLSKAEKEGLSHLHFLDLLLGAQADAHRERAVARRIVSGGRRWSHFGGPVGTTPPSLGGGAWLQPCRGGQLFQERRRR